MFLLEYFHSTNVMIFLCLIAQILITAKYKIKIESEMSDE